MTPAARLSAAIAVLDRVLAQIDAIDEYRTLIWRVEAQE